MRKSILAASAMLAFAVAAMGGNYAFPSPWNPAGKASKDINQWAAIIWDDNQYSGVNGSTYESKPNQKYAQLQRVNGIDDKSQIKWDYSGPNKGRPDANPQDTWTENPNELEIWEEGKGKNKLGIAWAYENLGNNQRNGGKGSIPMTFNMITGLYVNVWATTRAKHVETPSQGLSGTMGLPYTASQNYESDLGYWTGKEMGEQWNDADYWPIVFDGAGFNKVAIAWGREQGAGLNSSATEWAQQNFIQEITNKIKNSTNPRHEIGNHTIDHMETNSMLGDGRPISASLLGNDIDYTYRNETGATVTGKITDLNVNARVGKRGFAYITSGSDNDVSKLNRGMSTPYGSKAGDEMSPWGVVYNQVDEYGTKGHALIRGWAINVGHWMEEDVWRRYIEMSQDWLTKSYTRKEGGFGLSKSDIYGFRAPRLEVNSAMFYALKNLNYFYDCGIEEGYEEHVDGQNFLWPYTLDNGTRNSWTHANIGEKVFIDTMPDGLWEIPVNCFVVPQNIRASVVDHWNLINEGKKVKDEPMVASEWNGKITGFDFNMWVIFGMDKSMFLATMKNTLDSRLAGNKAPLQYGAHTDYYTPIYDNGTLLNAFNRDNYGLNITKTWNDWKARQEGTEEFVDYALDKGVIFLTGKALIDSLSKMNADGEAIIKGEVSYTNKDFVGYTADGDEMGQNLEFNKDVTLTIPPKLSDSDPDKAPVFTHIFTADEKSELLGKITHISLEYKSRTATAIRLLIDANGNGEWDGADSSGSGDIVREVILAHRYSPIGIDGKSNTNYENSGASGMRKSGKIPLTSFDFSETYKGIRNYSSIDQSKIIGIEIAPLVPENNTPLFGQKPTFTDRDKDFELKFNFDKFTFHTGTPFEWKEDDLKPTSIVKTSNVSTRTIALAGISSNTLKLNIAQAGRYDVKVYGVNGRLLQSFNAANLSTGVNTLRLNHLSSGVYLIKIQGINTKQQLTKSAMVL